MRSLAIVGSPIEGVTFARLLLMNNQLVPELRRAYRTVRALDTRRHRNRTSPDAATHTDAQTHETLEVCKPGADASSCSLRAWASGLVSMAKLVPLVSLAIIMSMYRRQPCLSGLSRCS